MRRATYKEKPCNDIGKALKAIQQGAKIVPYGNGHAIEYTQGGHFAITLTVYRKLTQ